MRNVTFFLLFLAFNAFGQDTTNVRTFGASPTDISILSRMPIAIPQAGAAGSIPSTFRMDIDCPPVTNQCMIGSCVSQATGYGLCGILAKRQNLPFLFSAASLHYYIKACSNDCGKCGSNLGAAANRLMNFGIPASQELDNRQCDPNSCNYPPDASAVAFRLNTAKPIFITGLQYQPGYKRDAIRYYISQNYPVPIAMALDQSFVDGSAFNNPTDTWQYFYGQSIGGHAMLIVGYDDNRGAFLVMNSWGTTNWNLRRNDPTDNAKPGYCWISYNVIENYCYEAFVANENVSSYSVSV